MFVVDCPLRPGPADGICSWNSQEPASARHPSFGSGSTNLYAEIAAGEEQVNNLEADWGALTDLLRVVTDNSEDSVGGSP
ncbi:hypothetical protein D6T63_07625 [Arthrobacter cheniae]|uniref:Uncharacterized protein n=1 Tax=Arthrobacter cheniae TaxID=1258888 RepID=A0A3A5MD08_9MICC|nr:hypothetical protein [Arthrobacter cheniae]RJT81044.1 hypothetical protein D6T63_07625 [Arthrobacter cheniae]